MRIALIALYLFLVSPASGEECQAWNEVANYLAQYGQIPSHTGLTDASNTMTIFVHPTQGTWSIVHRTPLGCARIWAHGIGWRWLSNRQDDG